jgi:hypothetical protein
MITFEWSWFAFIMGVLAAISVGFWLLVIVAFKQWKKTKVQSSESSAEALEKMMGNWDYKNNRSGN